MRSKEEREQEWNEQKLPKASLGYSGGRVPRRSTEEEGWEGGGENRTGNWSPEDGPSKDQTPYQGGIVRRFRMKKKKAGKKATEWQDKGEEEQHLDCLIVRRSMEGRWKTRKEESARKRCRAGGTQHLLACFYPPH